MKNLKKAIAALSLLMCLFLMCSCMRMEMGIIINADGTGRVFTEVAISEKTLEDMGMTKEQFLENITQSEDNDKYEDWLTEDVERIVTGETGDETYVGVRYYKDGKLDEITGKLNDSDESSVLSYDMRSENGKRIVTIRIVNENDGSVGGEASEYMTQGMMSVYFSITAPAEIIDTNGTISQDKRTVTWDILSVTTGADKEITLTVTYKDGLPIVLILAIAGGVVVLGIFVAVIIVAVKKKKKASASVSYEAQPIPVPTVPSEQGFTTDSVQPVQPEETVQPVEAQPEQTAEAAETAPTEQTAESKNFCENCGAKLEYESAFCMNCGEPVKK